jgi:hypothetical protein
LNQSIAPASPKANDISLNWPAPANDELAIDLERHHDAVA